MKTASHADPHGALALELDGLLGEYTARYEQLAALGATHREAIRAADGRGVEAAAAAQAAVLHAVSGLESRRGSLVNRAADLMPALRKRTGIVTLTDVARALPGDHAPMAAKAAKLKTLVESVRDQANTVGGATRSLLAHVEGLMRQVSRQLSHAGTYGKRGFVEPGGTVVSALDVRL